MGESRVLPGRPYLLKIGARTVGVDDRPAEVQGQRQHAGAHRGARRCELNEIGVCRSRPRPADRVRSLRREPRHGRLHPDRPHHQRHGRRRAAALRAAPVAEHALAGDRGRQAGARGAQGPRPCVVWFTGLSGAGKSTIANLVEKKLHALGRHTYLLDGDNVRHGLNKDLGFTEADRVENIRRVAEVARLMVDAGPHRARVVHLAVPGRAGRCPRTGRGGEFCEVFVDTPLDVAEHATRRGSTARRGAASSRTSPASIRPTRSPEAAELHVDTTRLSPDDAADCVINQLASNGCHPRKSRDLN